MQDDDAPMQDVPQLPTIEEDDDGDVPMDSDAGSDVGEPLEQLLEEQMDIGEGDQPIDDDEDESSADEEIVVDVEHLRQGTEAAADSTVRDAGMDPSDILGAAEYEENVLAEPEPMSVAFDSVEADVPSTGGDGPPSSPGGPGGPGGPGDDPGDDPSRLVPSQHNPFLEVSQFEMALATYADLTSLSRTDWARLRQILHLLVDENGRPLDDIARLPRQLSTLRDRLRKRLPLMDMREADIPLNVLKMPTLPPGLKPQERQKFEAYKEKVKAAEDRARAQGRRSKVQVQPDEPLPSLSMKLTFFDPLSMFKNLIASDIYRDTHHGPAEFVDEPTELYQSTAWASSIRASEGVYAHMWVDGKPTATILPADFIYYHCMDEDCYCQRISDKDENTYELHIGRVYAFGVDKRESSPTHQMSGLTLQIQECLRPDHRALGKLTCDPPLDADELILQSDITVTYESKAFQFIDVYVDKVFGETHEDPAANMPGARQRITKSAKPKIAHKKYNHTPTVPARGDQYYQVRRMLLDGALVAMCHTHPIRAELEIEHFGRAVFEDEWDVNKVDVDGYLPRPRGMSDEQWEADKEQYRWHPIACLPMLTFIDGFGVFRNSYRTLMGMYVTPAGMTAEDRSRPRSILPLVLGPHASDFGDVIKALASMAQLDKGLLTEINGVMTRLCAFSMCYVSDMPQQAENSGLKGPRAYKFCCACFIPKGQLATDPEVMLNFDVVTHGRFHVQTTLMQHMMSTQLQTREAKDSFGTQWGINDPSPALTAISPALDLIMTRPMDAAHSEYNGLSQLMHLLLRDGILEVKAREEYALAIRVWKFPPGGHRLQSPIHHLASYSLSDHAEWSIIAPPFLRHWLRKAHIKPLFASNVELKYPEDNPVDMVVKACAAIAKSNSVLMSYRVSKADRDNLEAIVYRARKMFNQLSMAAAASMGGSRGPTPSASRAASLAGSPAASPGPRPLDTIVVGHTETVGTGTGAVQFLNNTLRPNIHVGVHWKAFADEYGLPVNLNTLMGENLHRLFKALVYATNYTNVEKVILMKVNVQETIRLVLRNAFKEVDPELTTMLTDLYQKCPDLYEKVLSRSDRSAVADDLDLDDFVIDVNQSADDQHRSPTAINAIPASELRNLRHRVNDDERLPLHALDAKTIFRGHIRLAYHQDYGKSIHYPATFQRQRIQWLRKFGFTSKALNERFTFGVGDYIKYMRDGDDDCFGQIDHIFLLDNLHDRHIFVVLQPVRRTNTRNDVLDLEIMEKMDEVAVIGITAVQPVRLYMLDVDGVGLVWNNWELHML